MPENTSKYGPGPHVAVDAVVFAQVHNVVLDTWSFKLLVITRPDGTTALPGGFVDPDDDSILSACMREVREETGLVLKISDFIREVYPQKDKHRDPRSWVISFPHSFFLGFRFEEFGRLEFELPTVHGMDDAVTAEWIDKEEIKKRNWFLDHLEIIKNSGPFVL